MVVEEEEVVEATMEEEEVTLEEEQDTTEKKEDTMEKKEDTMEEEMEDTMMEQVIVGMITQALVLLTEGAIVVTKITTRKTTIQALTVEADMGVVAMVEVTIAVATTVDIMVIVEAIGEGIDITNLTLYRK